MRYPIKDHIYWFLEFIAPIILGIIFLIYTTGCTNHKVDMNNCFSHCVTDNVDKYLSRIYSTQDHFLDQIKELCIIQEQGKHCCGDGGFFVPKDKCMDEK